MSWPGLHHEPESARSSTQIPLWRHPYYPQGPALPVLPPLNPPKDWQVSSEGAEMIVNTGPDGSRHKDLRVGLKICRDVVR